MDLEKILIDNKSSLRKAIKTIDLGGIGIVFITDNLKQIIGVITDGDFRRAILKGVKLDIEVSAIMNKNFVNVVKGESEKTIINTFLKYKINNLPVLLNGKLVDILQRKDYNLEDKVLLPENNLAIPVVIMAGGKGTRMTPFTNIFPKPLIPIGNKSMLEVIMDEYKRFGLVDFHLTINYKGNLIKAYFDDFQHDYKINYIREDKFLGTAGALKLLKTEGEMPIFVSNCDILIKENYLKLLEFHQKGNYDMTLIAALIHHQVPYGVCTIKNGGELNELSEKPEYDYLVNSGMYILNSSVLELIPENEFFHITHLMEKIKTNGGNVGVYPVSEKSWIDVGQWEEYQKSLNRF